MLDYERLWLSKMHEQKNVWSLKKRKFGKIIISENNLIPVCFKISYKHIKTATNVCFSGCWYRLFDDGQMN